MSRLPQFGLLLEAITEAFPTPEDLALFVQAALGLSLDETTKPDKLPHRVFELVQYCEAQALIAKLHKLLRQNVTFRIYRRRLLDENRWRASRYGIDGKLIDFGQESEMETRSLIHEFIEFVADEVAELGSRREMNHIERILHEGTGADRQIAVWERTHEMKAVVDHIVAETYEGLSEIELEKRATVA